MDYDYLIDRKEPSIVAIIASGRKRERYFWGESEVSIPVFSSIDQLSSTKRSKIAIVINVQSARRVLSSTKLAFELLANLKIVTIFAEQTPESHTVQLIKLSKQNDVLMVGPSSVGMLIPGYAKIGAIGGTQHSQLSSAGILEGGNTAVVSTSGGIVNELILTVIRAGLGVSFALALGGDRYPITTPAEAMMMAQSDPQTERIVFFGELGGVDEYEIVSLMDEGKLTKELIVYIAGTVAELFDNPPQFGHAKALAQNYDESSSAKKDALRKSGAIVCDTFAEILKNLEERTTQTLVHTSKEIGERKHSLIVSHISGDKNSDVQLLGKELLQTVNDNTIASLVLSMLLGKQVESKKAFEFVDFVIKLLSDHGPYVSGALNTIVAARAGKDLVSSLSAGLLTIGPRFGGAINDAARNWIDGAAEGLSSGVFVESFAKKGGVIPGIGHKKYHTELPDPRVKALLDFAGNKNGDRYLNFALGIEAITTTKKSNLILNVDGAIAAVMLDILESELGYSEHELRDLAQIEFFNALFVLSRSIGFTGHYLDQRRHDEGLLRLSDDDVRYVG
ncbi:MAG TPA: citrate/2-methylcitrate synthase [Candidatus Microsaccharimonas sp.]